MHSEKPFFALNLAHKGFNLVQIIGLHYQAFKAFQVFYFGKGLKSLMSGFSDFFLILAGLQFQQFQTNLRSLNPNFMLIWRYYGQFSHKLMSKFEKSIFRAFQDFQALKKVVQTYGTIPCLIRVGGIIRVGGGLRLNLSRIYHFQVT